MPDNNYEDGVTLTVIAGDGSDIKQVVPVQWLMDNDNCRISIQLADGIEVLLSHKEELLILYTSAKVDITISGELHMLGLQVETKGQFRVNNDMPQAFHEGASIKAHKIVLDHMLESANFISLVTPDEPESSVQINEDLGSKKLYVCSPTLGINALVDVENAFFYKCRTKVSSLGKLMLGRPARPPAAASPQYFIDWRRDLGDLVYTAPFSTLQVPGFTSDGLVHFMKTNLISEGEINFTDTSKTELFESQLVSNDFYVAPRAVIEGNNSHIHFKNRMRIDGDCRINRLKVFADNTEINNIAFGEDLNARALQELAANPRFSVVTLIKSAIQSVFVPFIYLKGVVSRICTSLFYPSESNDNNVEINPDNIENRPPLVIDEIANATNNVVLQDQPRELMWTQRTASESPQLVEVIENRPVYLSSVRPTNG